jgi:cobalt/nickel transport system permease protein
MLLIDNIAHTNSLRNTHPMEKFIFFILSMVIVLLSENRLVPGLLFIIMSILIVFRARVRACDYIKVLMIPVFFVLISIVTIILIIKTESFESLTHAEVLGFYIGITEESLMNGVKIFSRSISAISCFYFFILTTPITDLEYLLIKLRVPLYFREIFILVYRFIFIIFEISRNIYLSQKSRLGYVNIRRTYISMGSLISSVLLKSLCHGEKSYQALQARGYAGELCVLREKYQTSLSNWKFIAVLASMLIAAEIVLR